MEISAFIFASNKSLCVESGKEAIDLLFKESTRVNSDILRSLEYYSDLEIIDEQEIYIPKEGIDFPLKIVIRKWIVMYNARRISTNT
jgi:hypothetical protein